MKKTILTTVLLLTLCQIGFTQKNYAAKLDNYFNALEENDKFMGSVAISQNGEIIYTKSIGFADVEKNIKATKNL
jgi:CubicO group peptidase (beta-lactamase class C family)